MPIPDYLKKLLQNTIGDEPQQEGIQPSQSPLDFLPYTGIASTAAKGIAGAGRGLAGLAQRSALNRLAGNEVGALGQQALKPLAMSAEEAAGLNPALAKFKATGQMSPEIAQAERQGTEALNTMGARDEAQAVLKDQMRDVGIDPLEELYRQTSEKAIKENAAKVASEDTVPSFEVLKKKLGKK